MIFEFDPEKSKLNKLKHGIDFEEARELWKDFKLAEIDAVELEDETRLIHVGKMEGKHWTAITTLRGGRIRIISVRRARKQEIRIYEGE